jgi:hypothetical protein
MDSEGFAAGLVILVIVGCAALGLFIAWLFDTNDDEHGDW